MDLQQLLEQVSKLSNEEKMLVLDKCVDNNDYVLDHRIITKDHIIEELDFRISNGVYEEQDEELWQTWIEENIYSEDLFNMVLNNSNQNLIYDYSEWNERDEDILNYIYFDYDDFIAEVKSFLREQKLYAIGI